MRVLLASASAAALLVGAASAQAADLGRPITKAPAMVPAPAYFTWNGFYIGGFVGAAGTDRDVVSTDLFTDAGRAYNNVLPYGYRLNTAVFGGGTGGFNWQAPGSPLVLGVEVEGGYMGLRRTVVVPGSPAGDTAERTRIGNGFAAVTGRVGFAMDRVLFYAKGGVAFVNKDVRINDSCAVAPCGPSVVEARNDHLQTTWTGGAGIEWALTPNWSIKGEYLYFDTRQTYGVCGLAVGGGAGAGLNVCSRHRDPGVHTAKLGINYRFNWGGGGPVVAAY